MQDGNLITKTSLFGKELKSIKQTISDFNSGKGFSFFTNVSENLDIAKLTEFNKQLFNLGKNASKNDIEIVSQEMKGMDAATREVAQNLFDLNKQYRSGAISLADYESKTQAITNSTQKLTTAQKAANIAVKAGSIALNTLASVGISFAISGLLKLIDLVGNLAHEFEDKITKIKELNEEVKTLGEDLDKLKDELNTASERIDELNSKDTLTIFEQEELDKLKTANIELNRNIELQKQALELKKQAAYQAGKETFETYYGSVVNNNVNGAKSYNAERYGAEEAINIYSQLSERKKELEKQLSDTNLTDEAFAKIKNELKSVNDKMSKRSENILDISENFQTMLDSLDPDDVRNADAIKYLTDNLDKLNVASGLVATNFTELYEDSKYSNVTKELDNLAKTGKLTEESFANVSGIESFKTAFESMGYSVTDVVSTINSNVADTSDTVDNTIDTLADLSKTLDDTFSSQSTLQSAFDKIQAGTSLTDDEVRKLIELCPELASAFTQTADGWTISSDNIISANQKIVKSARDSIQAQIDANQKIVDEYDKISSLTPADRALSFDTNLSSDELSKMASDANIAQNSISVLTLKMQMLGVETGKTDENIISLSNSISTLGEGRNLLTQVNEEIASTGEISASTMQDIIKKYPQLENSLLDYISGLKSEGEVYNELSEYYQTDFDNFNEYLAEKSLCDKTGWQTFIDRNTAWVNALADSYDIDLKHYDTFEEAKEAIRNKYSNLIPDSAAASAMAQAAIDKVSQQAIDDYEPRTLDFINNAADNLKASAVDNSQEAKISETYNKIVEGIKSATQSRIDALNDEKSAIEQRNEAEKNTNDLLEKQIALENAKNKTAYVYKEGQGFVEVEDEGAIKEAQSALDDAKTTQKTDAIDEKIAKLEDYEKQFSDIASDYTNAENQQLAKSLLGTNDLTNVSPELTNAIANGYKSALASEDTTEITLDDFLKSLGANVNAKQFSTSGFNTSSYVKPNVVNTGTETLSNSSIYNSSTNSTNSVGDINIYINGTGLNEQGVATAVRNELSNIINIAKTRTTVIK